MDRAIGARKSRRSPIACSIGSVDPTGGAGVTMDLQVYQARGVVGVAVIAAVSAQNSRRVLGLQSLPAPFVRRQLEAVWEQVQPNAVCIGLLPNAATIRAVGSFLQGLRRRPAIVIDPVIESSSGHKFLGEREVRELRRLMPLATLVTPNVLEAAMLASQPVTTLSQAEAAARALANFGCAVLVTGGHLSTKTCVDILAHRHRVHRYVGARINRTMRGSGGILAAAIVASLAQGASLQRSIAYGHAFVRRAFRRAAPLGSGKPQNL